jgi:hypothetical protein
MKPSNTQLAKCYKAETEDHGTSPAPGRQLGPHHTQHGSDDHGELGIFHELLLAGFGRVNATTS